MDILVDLVKAIPDWVVTLTIFGFVCVLAVVGMIWERFKK